MQYVEQHSLEPDVSFDGGDLDCGSGLLLLIRRHMDRLPAGGLLEIRSTESSVEEDLPAWCRMTKNELVSCVRSGSERRFLICKGTLAERRREADRTAAATDMRPPVIEAEPATALSASLAMAPAPPIAPLSVMGIGSWPRPRWMLSAIHEHVAGRMPDAEFHEIANDAVRLAVDSQLKAGVDVVTDGEQRRDSYASFVGGLLDGCQLIPITDLLQYVDDPVKFETELRALDVPAGEVRHPAVFGPIRRRRPLAVHELEFSKTLTDRPIKVALPGPYLLTRTMWMDCITDRAYATREALSADVVRVLREELLELLAAGAALVQFDEPVLTEVVFGQASGNRSFMCGALSEKLSTADELAFAGELLNQVLDDFPRERLALHICRGNWSRDESVALAGSYEPLVPLLRSLKVGTFFLELCTPRAGEIDVLASLPEDCRIGVGVVNQKLDTIEGVDEIVAKAEAAIRVFGPHRVLLNPDCGFATFADNPVASAQTAAAKLTAIVTAARQLRRRHRVE
jgi:5-methyltetrahydropteroyltriglutamate--homocysteine methyltransferase